jgi:hypothetical protein
MRFGTIAAHVTALSFCLAVCAFLAVPAVAVGFLAILVTGLLVLVIAYTVEMEDGSAIGHPRTPELFAMQQQIAPSRRGLRAVCWTSSICSSSSRSSASGSPKMPMRQ